MYLQSKASLKPEQHSQLILVLERLGFYTETVDNLPLLHNILKDSDWKIMEHCFF